jgi:hypothetical protein
MKIELEIKYDPVRSEERMLAQWKLQRTSRVVIAVIVLFASLGLFFLLFRNWVLSVLLSGYAAFQFLHQNKKYYFKRWEQNLGLSMQVPPDVYLRLDDIVVAYSGRESKFEMKWTVFTHFKTYNNFLFLIEEKMSHYYFIVDLTTMTEEESRLLMNFVQKKLNLIEA